ncbi:spermine/spermidine synthase domain-containing protein [Actinophytocola xanthii]|uniref:Spermidine synthase n=1 Tax=Actinophytocola xanthii TaxID=1912961 RepID=A0A1Q8CGX6_9PSEU|nr:spermidine synthase [Actinophytocola xanthii]OLF13594.1 spermidine synthase [Actinophytocola xanthii]
MSQEVEQAPVVLDRVNGVCGELVLRRVGADFEIIANGVFLMDTRNGESERLMVDAAAERMPAGGRLLVGGLGVGFSLRAALDHPRVGEVVVVEREPTVIEWNRGPLRERHGNALADPRVRCVAADLLEWLPRSGQRFAGLCLDIDNGPDWTVTDGNATLYGDAGLDMLAGALAPGGVLAVWSAGASEPFAKRLETRFGAVEALPVSVPRGEPDVVYLTRNGVTSRVI